ncbi:glycosyl transferase [Candidatus Aerophobetes bacterium]|uniref:Glycosyl transferase n=1 Tax=Aerophobetes bacterium TaxID=2030807 RepID=A0A2A4X0Q5_UNCAE|nr:MAG: glycosyl transferase [Candidatus Aerophobetes bacterium]
MQVYELDFFTLFASEKMEKESCFAKNSIQTSFIQNLPFAKKHARSYLPLFPLAIEQFDVTDYPVVISSSSCVAKGILTKPDQFHLCYCYTPMRYAWDLYFDYLKDFNLKKGFFKRVAATLCLHYLRMWDYQSASRVDAFVAISHFVARRIKSIYGRDSHVIYPPIDTDYFSLKQQTGGEFYVTASRMVPYKKMDLIIRAFSKMPGRELIVIGEGSERKKLEQLAKPFSNIKLVGSVDRADLRTYLQRSKAFVFAALEDFGIAPLEAQSCGTPVIAFGKGGSLETVVDGTTGLFFNEQTEESLCACVNLFEEQSLTFDPSIIRRHAQKFDKKIFQKNFSSYLQQALQDWQEENSHREPALAL